MIDEIVRLIEDIKPNTTEKYRNVDIYQTFNPDWPWGYRITPSVSETENGRYYASSKQNAKDCIDAIIKRNYIPKNRTYRFGANENNT